MGKNSGRRNGRKSVQRNNQTKNPKNLEVLVAPPPIKSETAIPHTPEQGHCFPDDEEYIAEIGMGSKSPLVLQSPLLKLVGTPTTARPQLVEIKDFKEVEVPKQNSKFDDLEDEFKGMMDDLEGSHSPAPVAVDAKHDTRSKLTHEITPNTPPPASGPKEVMIESIKPVVESVSEAKPREVMVEPTTQPVKEPVMEAKPPQEPVKTALKDEPKPREPEKPLKVAAAQPVDPPAIPAQPKEHKDELEQKHSIHDRRSSTDSEVGTGDTTLDSPDFKSSSPAQPVSPPPAHAVPSIRVEEAEPDIADFRKMLKKTPTKAPRTGAAPKEPASPSTSQGAIREVPPDSSEKRQDSKKAALKPIPPPEFVPKETKAAKVEIPAKGKPVKATAAAAVASEEIKKGKAKPAATAAARPATVAAAAEPSATDDGKDLIVGVAVVGFHHTKGPEVEYWIGPNGDQSDLWPYLPFQSLPDGSHSFEENICYFTVLYDPSTGTAPNPTPKKNAEGLIIEKSNFNNVETLFGISCTRQIQASTLPEKSDDITRSNVQKGLVVLARKPVFGPIKEKLKVVTRTYFDQLDFDDKRIIDNLYENVRHLFSTNTHSEGDFLVGTNPRELVYKFGPQAMTLFKALLLEKKIAFYASDTERLCTAQFSLVSLIPDLLNNLQDCGSPLLSTYETTLQKPTFCQTSNRASLLQFLGLPLQVFAAGGIFAPFVPLQLVDELKQPEMQYGLFGSTNKVFFTQGIDYDILVDVDNCKITIDKPEVRKLVELSSADKSFFSSIFSSVKNTWDSENVEQPTSLGYTGSEDFIRHSFEDYLIGLLSSAKYQQHLQRQQHKPEGGLFSRGYPANPLKAFNLNWAQAWQQTNNYRIFNKFTDEELFDIVTPSHLGLLKNQKRTDAIADVRGSLNDSRKKEEPAPLSFLGMLGWGSSKTPVNQVRVQQSGSDATSLSSSATSAVGSPSEPAEPAPTSPRPQESPRKLFFWR